MKHYEIRAVNPTLLPFDVNPSLARTSAPTTSVPAWARAAAIAAGKSAVFVCLDDIQLKAERIGCCLHLLHLS